MMFSWKRFMIRARLIRGCAGGALQWMCNRHKRKCRQIAPMMQIYMWRFHRMPFFCGRVVDWYIMVGCLYVLVWWVEFFVSSFLCVSLWSSFCVSLFVCFFSRFVFFRFSISFSSRFVFFRVSFPFVFGFGFVRAITWGGTHDVAVFTVTYCVIKTSLTLASVSTFALIAVITYIRPFKTT